MKTNSLKWFQIWLHWSLSTIFVFTMLMGHGAELSMESYEHNHLVCPVRKWNISELYEFNCVRNWWKWQTSIQYNFSVTFVHFCAPIYYFANSITEEGSPPQCRSEILCKTVLASCLYTERNEYKIIMFECEKCQNWTKVEIWMG